MRVSPALLRELAAGVDSAPAAHSDPALRAVDRLGQRPDTVTISPEARQLSKADDCDCEEEEARKEDELRELKARDREVRAHEQAHVAAAGPHAKGGPTYTFETGPDGRQYAVAGEVAIDVSPVEGDPEATIEKAQQVRRAALAPAEPSQQDMQVAAQASQMETQARAEMQSRFQNEDDPRGRRLDVTT